MNTKHAQFHLPTKPFNHIAAINRIAAGQSSIGYAMATAHADYNGHHISAYFNDYRGYYVCEHQWGERVVHARGSATEVLKTAISVYNNQGLGASLSVYVKPEDVETAKALGLIEGKEPPQAWRTWKHDEAANAYRMERQLGLPYCTILIEADSREDYDARIKAVIAARRNRAIAVN